MVDLMPTFSTIAGYEIPKDRMIDGIDQIDFFLGRQEKSNRDGFPVFNGDELIAYKYRNYKMHFIRLNSMFDAPEKLNMPQMFNLIQDPKELYPIDKVNVAEAWFMASANICRSMPKRLCSLSWESQVTVNGRWMKTQGRMCVMH